MPDAASQAAQPRAELPDRVPRASWRRRPGRAAAASAVAVLVAAVAIALLADVTGSGPPRAASGHHLLASAGNGRLLVRMPAGAGVQALAAGRQYLYLATDYAGSPPYLLSAYNRATGQLIRRVSVPAMPAALRTGPGGSVWLTFSPDQGGGPAGTWLLSPDLSRRSAAAWSAPDLLPTSPDAALLAGRRGLITVSMPAPGSGGHATARSDPALRISGQLATNALTPVSGRVAAQVTDGLGEHSHLIIAGEPGISYGGSPGQQVGSLTTEDGGVWTTISPQAAPNAGPLIRLSARLRLSTPAAIRANPVFRRSGQVWSDRHTLWVATTAARNALVCFTYHGRTGPVAALPVRGQPFALAATPGTVYVSLATSVVGVTSGVFAYAVPPRCR